MSPIYELMLASWKNKLAIQEQMLKEDGITEDELNERLEMYSKLKFMCVELEKAFIEDDLKMQQEVSNIFKK